MGIPPSLLTSAHAANDRVSALALRAALGLPEGVQRRLVGRLVGRLMGRWEGRHHGRPVVVDGQTLAADLQLMLALQRLIREPVVETLPIPEGRRALVRQARLAGGDQPIGAVLHLRAADRPARLYTPTTLLDRKPGAAPMPLLVFLHGGGFIYGDLDSHDAACRFYAERSGVPVLAVDYRLGPEHRFPAAHDDAWAAYRWVVENAETLGVDPRRIGVGGDSAGGNLAIHVAVTAAREGVPCAFQLLIYPATDATRSTRSAELFGTGFYLSTEFMDLANASYPRGEADLHDPRYSPSRDDLTGLGDRLAPAYLVTAGFDPLRDEGEAYAEQLRAAGVPVELDRFADQIHGFVNVVGVGRTSRAANTRIADRIRTGLGRAPGGTSRGAHAAREADPGLSRA